MDKEQGYRVVPFTINRQMVAASISVGREQSNIQAIIEVDISKPRQMIREIKQIIRSVTVEDCNKVARKVLGMDSERQISAYLRDAARKILPEAF